LGLALAFVLYVVVVFGLPEPLQRLSQIELVNVIFAAGTGAILIWSARRAWGNYHSQQDRLSLVLTVALPWLALAQLSQSTAPLWAASWWLYHLFMLGAFGLTMIALIMDYEHIRDFRLSHYFAALGLIVGVPAAVLLGEAAVRLTGFESVRWYMVGFSLVVILFLFLVLLGVVRRAQRILDERAAALQTEKQWRVDLTNLIVHDLKSPLSSILINLDSVLRGRLGAVPEEQQDRLSRARYSTEAMAALIDDLLAVERLEAGALHLTLVANNLTLLLEAGMEGMAVLADARQIELTARLADPLPFLPFDEALLQRVMQNLLTNAIKFSPPRSIIHVEAITTPTWVTISVIDSGPGVHPDQRQRIFEKFARVQGVEGRGHGLGLSLCKLVIEAHSGHIWVEDGPDGGSCFAFSLPLSAKQSTVSPDLS
jgi:signal transduction histidine kinase